ncbi:hypothetical protein [Streptomyces scabiei]|uniref:hypothetical protein n=1 Tax=Streptomyces scabiei TaxID=1930 RepID=UPI0029B2737C|nr:hypothetical protein [Streptomyces scabiei]MDX2800092.1 hypothetical protein [Streptomyces scabiei]
MPDGTISEDRFEEFRALHEQGLGRNAIAREMGIKAVACISRTAEHLGLTFDRSRIQAATAARMADLAERRSLLAEDLQGDAEKLREQIWQPHLYWDWGGKGHEYDEKLADEPSPGDKRALMSAVATAVDRSLKLVPAEASSNLDSAKSMLSGIGEALVAFTRAEDEREAEAQAADGDGGGA